MFQNSFTKLNKLPIFMLMIALVCTTSSFAHDKKRAYFGARLGTGVGLTRPLGELEEMLEIPGVEWKKGGASFDFAPFVSLQLADVFALQTEMLVTQYGGEYSLQYKDTWGFLGGDINIKVSFNRRALIIPLLAKVTLHPNIFVIQAFLGPHLTANVGKWNATYNLFGREEKEKFDDEEILEEMFRGHKIYYPPLGVTGGIGFGVKAGPGNVFVDARFVTDAGVITQDVYYIQDITRPSLDNMNENLLYRAKLSFTVGYEFGFGNR